MRWGKCQDIACGWLHSIGVASLFGVPFAMLAVSPAGEHYLTAKTEIFRAMVVVAIVCALACRRVGVTPLLTAMLACCAALFLADVAGLDPLKSLTGSAYRMEGFPMVAALTAYFAALGLLSARGWRLMLWSWVLVCSIAAVSALYTTFFGEFVGRAEGLIRNPDFLAVFLLFGVFFALALRLEAGVRARTALDCVEAILLAAIYFCGSRSVFLGLVVGFFVMAALGASKFAARGAVIGLIAAAGADYFLDRAAIVARLFDLSSDERLVIWRSEWAMVMRHPWLGWGQDAAIIIYNGSGLDRAHNLVLDVMLSGGAVALAAYGVFFFVAIKTVVASDVLERAVVLGAVAAYLTADMFTFDTITSYVPLASLLGWVNWRCVGSQNNSALARAPALAVA